MEGGGVRSNGSEDAIAHGGDLDAARRLFPGAPEPWIDLSTGINPVPYPLPPFEASALHRLPTPGDLARLKAAAAAAYGAPGGALGPNHVAAAPGTQILIETLPRLVPAARVAVIGPTYAEHAAAWTRSGHTVRMIADPAEVGDAEVLVAVSPNNPDGRVFSPAALIRALGGGGLVVLDQAFADLEAAEPAVPGPSLLVLRSFGKTYGLAGLRLGFALAEPTLARRIEVALGPWAVSGPAITAGCTALADTAWRRAAAGARAADAARLNRMIARAGGRIVGGTALFRTAAFADAPGLFRRLGEAGIFVRRFAEAPERLRFGLPADKAAWCRLSRILR